jgi:hypothetical protein
MIEAIYWWDQAAKFQEEALTLQDAAQQAEFLDLAQACEAVAIDIEDRATGG